MTRLPLDDVTVIGLEQAAAAPYATRQLADLGARVIKVERPGRGDFARDYDHVMNGESSAFVWLNRGKESIQLDLKDSGDLETLHKLLTRADVLVANLAPRVCASLGITVEALAELHPRLIVCLISGYAPEGPTPAKKAYDALVQAETGVMSVTGTVGSPAKVGIPVGDIATGSFAFSGILAALRHRDRTGEVLPVHVTLFSALTEWMTYPMYYAQYSERGFVPMGTAHPAIAPYGTFRCADGATVMISVQNEREWRRLCAEVLSAPELADDSRFVSNSARVAHRDALEIELSGRFALFGEDEVVARLDAAEIAWGRLNSAAELGSHPELADARRWLTTPTPSGDLRTLAPPASPGGRHARDGAVPALGAHTDVVLAEIAAASGVHG